MAASAPLFRPVHTCSGPLVSIISCFVTLVTHFAIILLTTSPTLIGRTSPLPLSSGINRLAKIGSIVAGSTSSVQSLLGSMAMASQRLVLDFLKDLLASTLLKPFASIPEGPPEPFVLSAASFIVSPFIW